MTEPFLMRPAMGDNTPVLPRAAPQPPPEPPVDPQAGAAQQVAAALAEANSGEPTDGAPYQDWSG